MGDEIFCWSSDDITRCQTLILYTLTAILYEHFNHWKVQNKAVNSARAKKKKTKVGRMDYYYYRTKAVLYSEPSIYAVIVHCICKYLLQLHHNLPRSCWFQWLRWILNHTQTQVDRDTAAQAIYQQLVVTISKDNKCGATGGSVDVLGSTQAPKYVPASLLSWGPTAPDPNDNHSCPWKRNQNSSS